MPTLSTCGSLKDQLYNHHAIETITLIPIHKFTNSSYLLTSRELELGPPESLNDGILVFVMSPHAHQGLSNADAGHGSQGLAESTSHPCLEPIGTSARQHFVDPQHVEGVDTDPDVELILGGVLDQVLKGEERINH